MFHPLIFLSLTNNIIIPCNHHQLYSLHTHLLNSKLQIQKHTPKTIYNLDPGHLNILTLLNLSHALKKNHFISQYMNRSILITVRYLFSRRLIFQNLPSITPNFIINLPYPPFLVILKQEFQTQKPGSRTRGMTSTNITELTYREQGGK